MALFEHFAPWAPFGRRQVRFKGMVVFGDGGSEVARTMQEVSLLDTLALFEEERGADVDLWVDWGEAGVFCAV